MSNQASYQPPFTLIPAILRLVAEIAEAIGRLSAQVASSAMMRLRCINRIRTIQGSLAIEGNTLSEGQITAVLEGKRVIAPPREIWEARNAIATYDRFEQWRPQVEGDLLDAHRIFVLRMIFEAVSSAATPQVTPQVEQLLQTLVAEMSREELQSTLGLQDRKSFRARYLTPSLAEGLIEMTLPEKPNSRLQKYRLTDKGRRWLQRQNESQDRISGSFFKERH